MNRISFGVPSHLVPETPQSSIPTATRGLLIFVILLVTFGYTMPLHRAWMVSVEENYGAVADDMEVSARDGSWPRRIALVSLGVFGIVALASTRGRQLHVRGLLATLCIGYLAWSAASVLWATEPRTALTRLVSFSFEVLAALAIAKRLSPRQFVSLVWWTTLAWMSLGFLAELSHDSFTPSDDGYRFSGLFHPNTMGAGCALLILASLYELWAGSNRKLLLLSVLAAATMFTVLTGSRAAMGGAILTAGVVWLGISSPRKSIAAVVMGLLVLGFLVAIAGSELTSVAGDAVMLGRNDRDQDLGSLTGRVPLWNELLVSVAERPIAGFGFNSFWTSTRIAELSQGEWGDIPNGHSLYIDTILSGGLIGAGLFFAVLFGTVATAIAAERRCPRSGYGFVAATVLYCLVNGIAETTMGISWFLQLFTLAGVAYMAVAICPAHAAATQAARRPVSPIHFGNSLRWEP